MTFDYYAGTLSMEGLARPLRLMNICNTVKHSHRQLFDVKPIYNLGNRRVMFAWRRHLPDHEVRDVLTIRAVMMHSKLADKRLSVPFTPAQYQETLPQSSALRKGYDPPPKPSPYLLMKESSRLHEMHMLPHGVMVPDVSQNLPMTVRGATKACLKRKCHIDAAALMELLQVQSRRELLEKIGEQIFETLFEEVTRQMYKHMFLQRAKEIALMRIANAQRRRSSGSRKRLSIISSMSTEGI